MPENIEGIRYLNIKITENSLKEIGCPSVPKDIIKNITLEYGKISERPIWQLNTGIIIALIGLYPVWRLINFYMYGGKFFFIEATIFTFFIVGLGLIYYSFKKGFYLSAETNLGKKRFVFSGKADIDQLESFLSKAKSLGYNVDRNSITIETDLVINEKNPIISKILVCLLIIMALTIGVRLKYYSKGVFENNSPESILKELPHTISNFIAEEEIIVYQNKELGAALGYIVPDNIKATIYIYNLGNDKIIDGINSDVLEYAYIQAKKDIAYYERYKNVNLIDDRIITIDLGKNEFAKLLNASFLYDEIGKDNVNYYHARSELYMAAKRNNIIKLRITYITRISEYASHQIEDLLRYIFASL